MAWSIKIVDKYSKKKYIVPLNSILYVEDAVTDHSEGSTFYLKNGAILDTLEPFRHFENSLT